MDVEMQKWTFHFCNSTLEKMICPNCEYFFFSFSIFPFFLFHLLGTYISTFLPASKSGCVKFRKTHKPIQDPEANILDSSPDRSRGMNSTFLEIWEAIVPISSKISNLFKFWAQVKGIQVDFSIYSIKKQRYTKCFTVS